MSTEEILGLLNRKYLAMVNLSELADLVLDDAESLTTEFQRDILQVTVLHETSQMYPPSVTYRKSFLKKMLNKLETSTVEILDDLYEEYAALMIQGKVDMQCFKTYVLPECALTLKENQQIISGGTTGLCTWPASQHLAEWALENRCLFENRCVLELGSGLGLAGLVISKTCDPKRYIFSDCHEQVLQKLAGNIVLNYTDCDHTPESSSFISKETIINTESLPETTKKSCDLCRTASNSFLEICEKYWNPVKCQTSSCLVGLLQLNTSNKVQLCQLDWECIEKENIVALFDETDVIVAADVVYDPCVVPALVNILHALLNRKLPNSKTPIAYIASTIRNPDTREVFIEALDSVGIRWTEIASPKQQILFYDRDVAIQILKLYS